MNAVQEQHQRVAELMMFFLHLSDSIFPCLPARHAEFGQDKVYSLHIQASQLMHLQTLVLHIHCCSPFCIRYLYSQVQGEERPESRVSI